MRPPIEKIVPVSCQADVMALPRIAKEIAMLLGFDPEGSEEIGLAASEIGSNLIKHARGGELKLVSLYESGRTGIEMETTDHGPGIKDVEKAITDGFSTAGGLGYGLGTVNRIMDELNITSKPDGKRGTRVTCRRWVRALSQRAEASPLLFGVAVRPHPGTAVCGDAFIIKQWRESALVGIIDGLGHGELARHAAQTARQYVENHFDQPLAAIFQGVERACRATRGVVMALVRLDWLRLKLTHASVGNIEVRMFGASPEFIVRRGIIGRQAPHPVVTEHQWDPESLMVLHSDGLTSRWQWEDFDYLADRQASEIASRLLKTLATKEDDATVLVVKSVVS